MTPQRRIRRGIILVMVLAMCAIIALLIVAITSQLLWSHRITRDRWRQEQAWWVAQSELDRQAVIGGQAADRSVVAGETTYQIQAEIQQQTVHVSVADTTVEPAKTLVRRTIEIARNENSETESEDRDDQEQ